MELTNRPFEQSIGARDLTHWRTPMGRWLARLVMRAGQLTTWRLVAWALAIGGTVLVLGLVWLASEVYEQIKGVGAFSPLDQPMLHWAVHHRPSGVAQAVTWFTDIGGPIVTPVVAVVALGLMTWRWRTPTPIVLGLLAGAGSLAITLGGKLSVGRARPPLVDAVPPYERSFSFPSGHATNAVVIGGIIAYVLLTRASRKTTRVLIIVLAVLYAAAMGFSRVYLGHHWASDVMAGWLIGSAWLALVITAHRLQLTHHRYHEQVAELERDQAEKDRLEKEDAGRRRAAKEGAGKHGRDQARG
ncbi:phosphatase PAP2 family protein [Aestuariimicrobium kwangyangense]|uniref:phosphatase PAP2 family protein n=1 Tax=Aestuariimicrobium kwangyangense TaxID=396389 RepID=UPI0003B6DAEB|nr:phosphatase PAP2 family protein [Aestuariimicrobium kwangyangense]